MMIKEDWRTEECEMFPGVRGIGEVAGNEETRSPSSGSATDPMVPRKTSEFTFLSSPDSPLDMNYGNDLPVFLGLVCRTGVQVGQERTSGMATAL